MATRAPKQIVTVLNGDGANSPLPAQRTRKTSKPSPIVTEPIPAAVFKTEDRTGMSISYVDTDFPETSKAGRKTEVNPHTTGVKVAVERHKANNVKGLSFTLPTVDEKEVKRHLNWLRSAGTAEGVSVRIEVVKSETSTQIIFRATDKIVRARKASVTPDVPVAATPDQAGF